MKIKMTGPAKESYLARHYEKRLEMAYFAKHEKFPLNDEHIENANTFQKIKLKVYGVLERVLNFIYKPFRKYGFNRKIRIDDYDLWSADVTIGYVVHAVLVKLKEVKQGSPVVDDVDVPEHLRDGDIIKNDPNAVSKTHEKWDWVLDEMIFAFEHIGPRAEAWEREYETGEFGKWTFEEIEGRPGFKSVNIDMGTYVSDDKGKAKVRERIQNGLMLFAKYHGGLWD